MLRTLCVKLKSIRDQLIILYRHDPDMWRHKTINAVNNVRLSLKGIALNKQTPHNVDVHYNTSMLIRIYTVIISNVVLVHRRTCLLLIYRTCHTKLWDSTHITAAMQSEIQDICPFKFSHRYLMFINNSCYNLF